jgi:hypothetical protein
MGEEKLSFGGETSREEATRNTDNTKKDLEEMGWDVKTKLKDFT